MCARPYIHFLRKREIRHWRGLPRFFGLGYEGAPEAGTCAVFRGARVGESRRHSGKRTIRRGSPDERGRQALVRTAGGRRGGSRADFARGTFRMLDALARIHRHLETGRAVSTRALEDELEASRRTVLRYIAFFRESLGADIVYDPEQGGYRYSGKSIPIPGYHLTEGDLYALYVASPILAQYRGTALGDRFDASFRKIAAHLPERVRSRLVVLPSRITAKGPVPRHGDSSAFARILDAASRERELSITYFSAHRGVTTVRKVDPYALSVVGSRWYLLARDHLRGRVLRFALERIWSAAETGRTFERPAGFTPGAFLKDAFGIFEAPDAPGEEPAEIRIRFDAFAARYVRETVWHPSQRITALEDGRIELSLRVRGSVEVEQFVLGWGEHAEVVAPGELRAQVRARVARMHAAYGRALA